jgi:hypothetical protein
VKKIVFLLILLSSCAAPTAVLKNDVQLETLNIYLEAGPQSNQLIVNKLNDQLDVFVSRYNSEHHRFNVARAESATDPSTLTITIVGSKFVSKGQQTGAVLLTLVGLSLPFIMAAADSDFYVFFYYFPQASTMTELSLSEDIRGPGPARRPAVYASPAFLKSPEKQIEKHGQNFSLFLSQLMKRMENGMRKK